MKYLWVLLAIFILLATPGALMLSRGTAQEQPADLAREPKEQPAEPAQAEEPAEEEKHLVYVDAPKLYYDAGTKTFHLWGGVVFTHEDVKLYCDEAWYNDRDDTARALGHLKVVDLDSTIVGDLITADFDEEKMVITGNVLMVTQKKKKKSPEESETPEEQPSSSAESSKSTEAQTPAEAGTPAEEKPKEEEEPEKLEDYWEKKTTITCQKVVYYYADDVKKALLYGPLKAVQEDKTAWADEAVYEDLKDRITLTGNVRVVTDKGDEFRCPKAVIAIEEDWIQAENVSGVWQRRKKEQEKEEEQPAPSPPAETPTPSTTSSSTSEETSE